jgi:hypothetical protein
MDVPAFASLAQLRIILVPVGNIARETFDKWAALIRSVENIRLGDIPVDNRDERGMYTGQPRPILYLFTSTPQLDSCRILLLQDISIFHSLLILHLPCSMHSHSSDLRPSLWV